MGALSVSTRLDVICLSPPGFPSLTLVQASRSGAFRGGVALEYVERPEMAKVLGAACASGTRFTISLAHGVDGLRDLVSTASKQGLECVVLCDANPKDLSSDIAALHALNVKVLIEVTDVELAETAEQAGADGIVVKGNESGGRVGEETSLILLQHVASRVARPVWVRGGVGLCSAAACMVGGAAGVVLDWQLALCAESELPEEVKARVSRMDGSETAILGQGCCERYRAYTRAGETAFTELKELEESLALGPAADVATLVRWRSAVEMRIRGEGGTPPPIPAPPLAKGGLGGVGARGEARLLPIGQDAAFAATLAKQFKTAAGISEAIRREASRLACAAARHRALRPDGPLARAHGTRFPILQGPMTRVSDTADFALAVAGAGGLPFLALALLRGPQVDALLEETKTKLAGKPWGVGILGFVPKELRDEQLAEVRKHPPPFAIIAGGRPDQAMELEREGIATYLHVPSPGLLAMFLKSGARRVIFEGRECGGHVGPRTSFVLWELMIQVILDHLQETGDRGDDYHVVFAGGIHDARSAAMVAALAAGLSERGVRVGVLIGTAYLFTKEAVKAGAILPGFQTEAIRCRQTILLESGVGHATRCADTEFGKLFEQEKRRLIREGRSKDEIREALERLNLGRLRIASKGITRGDALDKEECRPNYVKLDEPGQQREGMYMIGQVAALRHRVCTIEELHRDVSEGGIERLKEFSAAIPATTRTRRPEGPSDVAIVGMSCMLPKAGDKERLWENILNRVRATGEIPPDRWNWELYFNTDRRLRDNCYSKWGGFIDPVAFDPTRYGMPPNSIPSVEPLQLLVLEAVRQAIEDAGYADRPFDREHTSVILGAGGGVGEHGLGYGFRSMALHYLSAAYETADEVRELIERLNGRLPEWTEDSFAGLLINVAAGRVANRFDFGGSNYTVDAACASSLAAVRLAVEELESGSSNMVIVGGADTMQSPFAYLCFSNTQALSPTGEARPFDATADGIVISEGIAMAVLKRVEDAVRDGDRVYAVIKGVGSSSDGKDKGLTAPRPAGQIRALERAYDKAGFTPDTVSLIEAHGTGTVVGDQSEVESLTRMFTAAGAGRQECALGSVKSMIGHTKCTAGIAGLLKAALALHHKVLPPTIGVTKPNPKANFEKSPFYVNTEPKPWVRRTDGSPRRAGVSAFGFGGTNFHAVLEEYLPDSAGAKTPEIPGRNQWPAELFVWRAASGDAIVESVDSILKALQQGAQPVLRDLAAAVCREFGAATGADDGLTLALVAGSTDELVEKLQKAKQSVERQRHDQRPAGCDQNPLAPARGPESGGERQLADSGGVYFGANPLTPGGKIAFLFPGQGSQSVNMLRDLVIAIPGVRRAFEEADRVLGHTLKQTLSSFVFPRPSFTDDERAADEAALTQTQVAQPAMGATDVAMLRLLSSLGLRGDLFGGHSYGEYVALHAAGAIVFEDLIRISEVRGRLLAETGRTAPGAMAAVSADGATVAEIIADVKGVWAANFNAPNQTVISGTDAGIEHALRKFKDKGLPARRIKVSCAFHSPLIESAAGAFAQALERAGFVSPQATVFSNTTAKPHSREPKAIKRQLVEHLVRPVRFADEVLAMYEAGARVFVEVGPGRTLTALVEHTLKGKPFVAIAMNAPGREGITTFLLGLAQLASAACGFDPSRLFEGRVSKVLDLDKLVEQTKPAPLPRTTWFISGAKSVPINGLQEKPTTDARHTPPASAPQIAAPQSDAKDALAAAPPMSHATVAARPIETAADSPRPPVPTPQSANPSAGNSPENLTALVSAHQQLMTKFLDTHKRVMLGLMAGTEAAHAQPVAGLALSAPPEPPRPAPYAMTVPLEQKQANESQPERAPETTGIMASSPVQSPSESAVPNAEHAQDAPGDNGRTTGEPAVPMRDRLVKHLVGIVADRTGYPPDMLDLDLDLEADLGIDSIKRVEILGALQDGSVFARDAVSGDMETLAKLKTLRAIVDWVSERVSATDLAQTGEDSAPGIDSLADGQGARPITPPPPRSEPRVEASGPGDGASASASGRADVHSAQEPRTSPAASGVPRMTLRAVEHPIDASDCIKMISGAVVIIDDEQGVAPLLAEALRQRGVTALEIVRVFRGAESNGRQPRVDLADPAIAKEWVNKIRNQHGRIAAVVDLLPLAGAALRNRDDIAQWSAPLDTELHALFNVIQAAESDLRKEGNGRVLAVTRMGGAFGSLGCSDATEFWPGNGGVCGLVKTLAREWPEVVSRVVDFDHDAPAGHVADAVLSELLANDRVPEVGYFKGKRVALLPTTSPLADRSPQLNLDRESVVLITGGARGITADAAIELAERFGCRLVLLGRSPLPPSEEPPPTMGISDAKLLKSVLLQQLQTADGKVTPAKVEAAYGKLLRERETRANLAAMRTTGATVEYHRIDVTDTAAFGSLIDDLYRRFGRIDGAIHGAGVIEDKLIRDKTPDSFRRVFDPKVVGAFVLASKLRGDSLKFLVFFASVSGRYGNRGQCDYAAANEVISKLAIRLNAQWRGRVASLIWGPWESTGGMVSAELARQFAKAGVHIIARRDGKKAVVDEILFGGKNDAEVIFGGPLDVALPGMERSPRAADSPALVSGTGAKAGASTPPATTIAEYQPLLKVRASVVRNADGSVEVMRELDPQSDLYLIDHQLDGRPVMPMAMVLELFAESASLVRPDLTVTAVRDLRVLRGISFERGSQTARVIASGLTETQAVVRVKMRAEIGEHRHVHDTAEVELGPEGVVPASYSPLQLTNPRPLPMSIADAYEQWLFHGPLFAGIAEVEALGDNGIIATLSPSTPKRCLAESPKGHWLIDPVMVDSALQLIILWARTYLDMTPLPARLTCYHRYARPVAGQVRCEASVRHVAGTPVIHADFRFIDAAGKLFGWLEGLEGTCSKALNRLAATRVGQAADKSLSHNPSPPLGERAG